jgi:hypothetical protein
MSFVNYVNKEDFSKENIKQYEKMIHGIQNEKN